MYKNSNQIEKITSKLKNIYPWTPKNLADTKVCPKFENMDHEKFDHAVISPETRKI